MKDPSSHDSNEVNAMTDTSAPTGTMPVLTGIHHVTVPVSDVERAADWFAAVFAFDPCVTFEEEDGVTGILLEHASGAAVLLRADPPRAVSHSAYPSLTFAVADLAELRRWDTHLTSLGVTHTEVTAAHLGWEIRLRGPEMLQLRLTIAEPLDGVADGE
jgi:catechol 2,3-dioxygenase-like lactoylglutathione lyase family enzyme